jgi:hypothetical protein
MPNSSIIHTKKRIKYQTQDVNHRFYLLLEFLTKMKALPAPLPGERTSHHPLDWGNLET